MPNTGIPTTYNGIRYRSRLEAQWAAFFDKVYWRFEYEPEDLPGWIPDFALLHKRGPTYVEVKPLYSSDLDSRAAYIQRLAAVEVPQNREILLLGCDPFSESRYMHRNAGAQLGWFAREGGDSAASEAVIFASPLQGIDFASYEGNWTGRFSGVHNKYFGLASPVEIDFPERCSTFWAEAKNEVQWNGR